MAQSTGPSIGANLADHLGGYNYHNWNSKILRVARAHGLLPFIIGVDNKEVHLGERPTWNNEQYLASLAKIKQWEESDTKEGIALNFLLDSLDESNKSVVSHLTSPFLVYQTLSERHLAGTATMINAIMKDLYATVLDDESSVKDYLVKMRNFKSHYDVIALHLTTIDKWSDTLANQILITNIKGSKWMPLKLEVQKSLFDATSKSTTLTFNKLLDIIEASDAVLSTIEYDGYGVSTTTTTSTSSTSSEQVLLAKISDILEQALATRSTSNSTGNSKSIRPPYVACTSAGHNQDNNKSHLESDCWKYHPELRPKQQQQQIQNKQQQQNHSAAAASTAYSHLSTSQLRSLRERINTSLLDRIGFEDASNYLTYVLSEDASALNSQVTNNKNLVVVDSGASVTMFSCRSSFLNLQPLPATVRINTADGNSQLIATEGGTVRMFNQDGTPVLFNNAILVPGLAVDLISVPSITAGGGSAFFVGQIGKLRLNYASTKSDSAFTATKSTNSLYLVNLLPSKCMSNISSPSITALTVSDVDSQSWHYRLGHINKETVGVMGKNEGITGLNRSTAIKNITNSICIACRVGKGTKGTINRKCATRSPIYLGRIVSDLIGPLQVRSGSGARYIVSFLDECTRYVRCYFLTKKSEAFNKFKIFKAAVEIESDSKIRHFRTDRGGEFTSNEFSDYLQEHGITKEEPSSHSSEENGLIERFNRTIMEKAATMLHQSGLPLSYWAEAVNTAAYLYNLTPHSGNSNNIPLVEFYKNSVVTPNYQIDVSHLRPFGCLAFVLVPKVARSKLDDKVIPGIYLGKEPNSKSDRILIGGKVKIAGWTGVTYDESCFPFYQSSTTIPSILKDLNYRSSGGLESKTTSTSTSNKDKIQIDSVLPLESGVEDDDDEFFDALDGQEPVGAPIQELVGARNILPPVEEEEEEDFLRRASPLNSPPPERRVSSRINKGIPPPADWYNSSNALQRDRIEHLNLASIDWSIAPLPYIEKQIMVDHFSLLAKSPSPLLDAPTYLQATTGENASEWHLAMKSENDMLVKRGTGILVKPSPRSKVIGGRWVLTTKRDENGNLIKRKARWVALGFLQTFGVDYDETFSSVARSDTTRILLAKAAELNLELASFDVTGAFLAGDIDVAGILVQPPKGFTLPGKEGWVWELKRPLYGLKQAPRCWKTAIHTFLTTNNFVPTQADDCLYVYRSKEGIMFLSIHVDDGLLASSSLPLLHRFRDKLAARFESKWTDNPSIYLGLNIRRNRKEGKVFLSQYTYITTLLEKFEMSNCSSNIIPLSPSANLKPSTDLEVQEASTLPYRALIGGLMWAALGARPDIAHAVGLLARFASRPSIRHWQAARGVLRYLKGTTELCITYSQNSESGFTPLIYSDADFAGDEVTRRSTSAYVVIMCGGAVNWKSKAQTTVALSTTEAEYMALSDATKHAMWLSYLLPYFDQTSTNPSALEISSPAIRSLPTTILGDNQASIFIAKNPVNHNTTKHIHYRHHFIREKVLDGSIVLKWIPTDQNIADILTKSLDVTKHSKFTKLMGLEKLKWE